MNSDHIQVKFLQQIKEKLPRNLSFAEVLSEDLNVSTDSAYRRIRGETNLSIAELKTLCVKYRISLDAFLAVSNDTVLFNYRAIDPEVFGFNTYLESVIENLKTFKSFEAKELIYAAKDIPIFYLFMFKRLTAFKIFFWQKNILRFKDFEETAFYIDIIPQETIDLAYQVWQNYVKIPSSELWSEETINVTLRQIEFYYDSGQFKSKKEAIEICEDLYTLIDHLQRQATKGYKFDFGENPTVEDPENPYSLYLNEVTISDNTVIFRMGDIKVVHMAHNVISILTTTDARFCDYTYKTMKNIISNSILISVASEKERTKFCHKMRQKTEALINKIKNS